MKTSDRYVPPILMTLFVAMVPFVFRLPFWIILWCLFLWGYILLTVKYAWPWPKKQIRLLLTLCGFAGVLLDAGYVFGGDAYVGVLSVMAGLKPLEMRSHRDRMITVFIAYFIIITGLFESESLAITIYMFLSVFVTTAVLIHINHPGGQLKAKLRLSALIIMQAIPLMIVLFFLFPRIHGSLWGIPIQGSGKTGFTDSLSPGNISDLVRSHKTAFRAEFEESIPERYLLYWRGIVFEYFDGMRWHQGKKIPTAAGPEHGKGPVGYSITLEPHHQKWLFALDMPLSPPPIGRMLHDYTLVSIRKVRQKIRYQLKSYTSYNTASDTTWKHQVMELPDRGNPKARELAQKWADDTDNAWQIIDSALTFFRKNKFIYTLRPPLLRKDSIDDFLFRTQKGYCEHYASAFVFLMRAANIPSRIVGGYLGGQVNPYGNYLIVRQSDAHAWAEVWLDKKGWVRVDPTSAVAPERIESGIEEVLSLEEIPDFLSLKQLGPFAEYWKKIQLGWDVVNTQWDIWFVGYSSDQQKTLLSKIGIKNGHWKGPVKWILLSVGMISVFVFLFSIRILKKPSAKKDLVQQFYNEFCEKFARVGIPRRPDQGPSDYAKMIGTLRQDLKASVNEITELYISLRYGHGGEPDDLKRFKSLVKKIRIEN
ncbi:transglutaminase TgpA family protein [Desulfonema magnum]|uniref:Transglutaminase-like domain-containing protein, DUF3488 and DUF4129 n=1 Tax=Desulfonema magnum TaxID=45655 RepID=A0A975BY53_9BACT|nr:DUF3488 and DUF4129 domain-containing transglutaminase family protein [Desulfonema magnum]QTA93264.1 Transglutaminase-like domain-containing protein, DUF3488 and DUF4129 [Desulfonema magnum]